MNNKIKDIIPQVDSSVNEKGLEIALSLVNDFKKDVFVSLLKLGINTTPKTIKVNEVLNGIDYYNDQKYVERCLIQLEKRGLIKRSRKCKGVPYAYTLGDMLTS